MRVRNQYITAQFIFLYKRLWITYYVRVVIAEARLTEVLYA